MCNVVTLIVSTPRDAAAWWGRTKSIYTRWVCVCVLCLSVYTWPVPTPACPPALLHKTLSLAAIHHAIRRLHNHTRRNYKNHIIFISTPLSDVVLWKKTTFWMGSHKKRVERGEGRIFIITRKEEGWPAFIYYFEEICVWWLLLKPIAARSEQLRILWMDFEFSSEIMAYFYKKSCLVYQS